MSLDSKSLENLKPSNHEREFFTTFEKLSKFQKPKNKSYIKEMLNISNPDILKDFFDYMGWDKKPINEIIENNEPYKISHLDIDGKTLIELRFSGAKIGEILEHLRQVVINEPQKNKKELLLKEIP